jgi:hypothetical protein
MTTATTLAGLPVRTPAEAAALGYKSITTSIHSKNEKQILAGVASGRNPERACFIRLESLHQYELAVLAGDIKIGE